jgi:hypothetical protein
MYKNRQITVDFIPKLCLDVGMETQDLDLLAKFADIVEELTTQELDEAWAILRSHARAITNETIRTLRVGQPVMFRTQNRGDKYGTIEKVMRKRVKVRVTSDSSRDGHDHGFHTKYSNGELWTVQAGYIIPLED